jgi:YidC/Oxa1 family membrane protein insertase
MWDMLIINPMLNTLLWIYSILGNFGIAIILFTILVRMVTYPLTIQQLKGAQAMQDMQKSKEYLAMQKKYKDDKQKLQQEQMKLYKEMGVNPLGSCLPTLIQFPVIIGLYQSIIRALAVTPMQMTALFYNIYPFSDVAKLLPIDSQFLWMDLSQPERLYVFGYGIPVLAIIVLITTYFQSRLITPPSQPGEQGAQMTQMMNLYMPLLMGYLALTFAAGLALYFVTSNVITILQYAFMGKANWNNLNPFKKAGSE